MEDGAAGPQHQGGKAAAERDEGAAGSRDEGQGDASHLGQADGDGPITSTLSGSSQPDVSSPSRGVFTTFWTLHMLTSVCSVYFLGNQ